MLTIRAASLVGGSSALELIELIIPQTSGSNDNSLFAEIVRASQYFEPDEYGRRILNPAKRFLLMRVKDKITKSIVKAERETERIEALSLAIVDAADKGQGGQLWGDMVFLVRRPFHRRATADELLPTGEVELINFQQTPTDGKKAIALAKTLLARSSEDAEFRETLESWQRRAESS
jgi:hypothetical protein